LEISFRSYYGSFLCVTWSSDGKLLLTGSEDDLVSLWSLNERKLLCRGYGHHSWVSSVAFDTEFCTGSEIRFVSVGHDCHLLSWMYSPESVRRPRSRSVKASAIENEQKKMGMLFLH